jgi:uncharacterized membrane protein/mono/diheme cytochrome c family protein
MLEHLTEFIGRTHLVVLHFPIALLIVAAIVELLSALNLRRTSSRYTPSPTGTTMFVFALLATIASVITGLILGFDDGPEVDLHRNLGIATGVLVVITAIPLLASRRDSPGGAPRIYLTLLIVSAGAVGFTGHLGGDLTHGKGFLTRPLRAIFTPPPEPKPAATLDPASFNITQAQLDTYLNQIQPILDASCVECHGPDDAEDDIRLDALEYVLAPDLSVVIRGDADMSDLTYVIELPAGDPDIMPPEDHGEPLSQDQTQAIRDWVASLTP